MGSYAVLADVSRTLVELLRKNLTPEPVLKEELIGLCTPSEPGNYLLGLYLYNVDENKSMGARGTVSLRPGVQQDPPTPLTLQYLLAVYSKSEGSGRVIDEQRILGKAVQVLNDNARIPMELLQGTLKESNEQLQVSSLDLSFEDKVRIWSLFNQPYQLAMFYTVGPVYLDSTKVKTAPRVSQAQIELQKGKRR